MDDASVEAPESAGPNTGLARLIAGGQPTRFKPGQSGNPHGQPRGVAGLRKELRRQLDPYMRQKYIRKLLGVACDPEHKDYMAAVKLVWDRRDGPIIREVALTGGIPSVSFEVHLNAPGQRVLPALPTTTQPAIPEQRVIDVSSEPASSSVDQQPPASV